MIIYTRTSSRKSYGGEFIKLECAEEKPNQFLKKSFSKERLYEKKEIGAGFV